jgi:TrpR family trp operon transcriptional repressor
MSRKFTNELFRILAGLDTLEKVSDFLEGLLTPKELLEIPMRLQIVKMLKSGMSQREIADKLGVGIATVSRGSAELRKGSFKNIEN